MSVPSMYNTLLHLFQRHKCQQCATVRQKYHLVPALVRFVCIRAIHMMLLQVIAGMGTDDMNKSTAAAERRYKKVYFIYPR
jgi:hypothetical protein